VLDQDDEGFVLTGEQLFDFYDFVRVHYRSQNQKKYPASRTYTMIVVAGESGLRADEICHLDALPPHRDLFYEQNCLQTRYGKAAKGSGKRVRKTIFTPFAQDTLRYYETYIRPAFPNAHTNAALFLTESGERITYKDAWYHLSVVVKAARKAGLGLPARMGWHSLRKSFATNFMEHYPEQVWHLMEMLGHLNPSTLHHYVKHTRAYYDQSLNRIAQNLMKQTSAQGES
jgi:site-specific recombinase XerD